MNADGKVRLIAKTGRYAESDYTKALRKQQALGQYDTKTTTGNLANGGDILRERGNTKGAAAAEVGMGQYEVVFDATPDITEQGSTNYYEESGIRGPASILFYMGSPSRTFSLSAKLIARNLDEAKAVSEKIHRLKSWRMPESYTGGFAQKPPVILYLEGYNQMFKQIQVVMTDLSIEFSSEFDVLSYKADVDTLATTSFTAEGKTYTSAEWGVTEKTNLIPIIVPVNISLKEVHNVDAKLDGLKTFDILRYRTGNLDNW